MRRLHSPSVGREHRANPDQRGGARLRILEDSSCKKEPLPRLQLPHLLPRCAKNACILVMRSAATWCRLGQPVAWQAGGCRRKEAEHAEPLRLAPAPLARAEPRRLVGHAASKHGARSCAVGRKLERRASAAAQKTEKSLHLLEQLPPAGNARRRAGHFKGRPTRPDRKSVPARWRSSTHSLPPQTVTRPRVTSGEALPSRPPPYGQRVIAHPRLLQLRASPHAHGVARPRWRRQQARGRPSCHPAALRGSSSQAGSVVLGHRRKRRSRFGPLPCGAIWPQHQ
eukprot:scaffold18263_cov29-Tisochrysis_lutea.AAC.2